MLVGPRFVSAKDYGSFFRKHSVSFSFRCGRCKQQQPCTVTEGRCLTCEAGWNGTQCDQICNPGFFGGECKEVCPPCKDGHPCNHVDGKCTHCNPGWIGDR